MSAIFGILRFDGVARLRPAGLTEENWSSTAHSRSAMAIAALHELELTRPFHDNRVVELALAIPQKLYVKNGRNRYLGCAALKDIYPREFQERWRRNDDEIPDFQRMAKSIEPQLLAEIARMEKSEGLARYVDFAKIRALLAARGRTITTQVGNRKRNLPYPALLALVISNGSGETIVETPTWYI